MPGVNWQMRVTQVGNQRYHPCSPPEDSFWEVDVTCYDSRTYATRTFAVHVDDAPRVGDTIHANLAWGYNP